MGMKEYVLLICSLGMAFAVITLTALYTSRFSVYFSAFWRVRSHLHSSAGP